jgi:hypothetical protein
MLVPYMLGVSGRLEAIVLKTLTVFGKSHSATVVVREARVVEPLVSPPKLSCVEAGLLDRTRRQQLRVKRGRLEDAQAW